MDKFQIVNEKTIMKTNSRLSSMLLGAVLFAWPSVLPAQGITTNGMVFSINNGAATFMEYIGQGSAVSIPSTVLFNGVAVPVVSIGGSVLKHKGPK